MAISHSIIIHSDLTWTVFVHGHKVNPTNRSPLSSIPTPITSASLAKLVDILDMASICPGHPDDNFLKMADSRKGKFTSVSEEVVAFTDDHIPVTFNGSTFSRTLRTAACDILVHGGKCDACTAYRPQLRSMYSRWSRKTSTPPKFGNNRYLNTPQKQAKLKTLATRAYTAEKELRKLKEKLAHSTEKSGVHVDTSLHKDLLSIMEENDDSIMKQFPDGTFRRLFWEQQKKAASVCNPRQMRWHPVMIRWCLNLKLISSAAYHGLRSSGFVTLPSERTLRDYTHYVKSSTGFQRDVDLMLAKEAKLSEIPDWKRNVVLAFDEMKIKESLVYDKHNAKVLGFVDLGQVNNELQELEESCSEDGRLCRPVATHMLVLMVRGIFTSLQFPYAHFPTKALSADSLLAIIWEAVERLERLGLKVLVLTGDGASPNRKLFRLHKQASDEAGVCYKTLNPYAEERYVYFISDVPHLLKTTRNCWSHSFAHGKTRQLWVS